MVVKGYLPSVALLRDEGGGVAGRVLREPTLDTGLLPTAGSHPDRPRRRW